MYHNITTRLVVQDHNQAFLPNGPAILEFSCSMVIIVLGTVFNVIEIGSLRRNATKLGLDASTKLTLNLAVSDLMFCSVTLPLYWLQRYFRSNPFVSDTFCEVNQMTFFWTFELSLMSLAVVSLNRLVLICYNQHYDRIFSPARVWLMIVGLWLFSFALTLPPLTRTWGQFIILRDSVNLYCGLLQNPLTIGTSPRTFLYCIGFVVPFTAMLITFTMIGWKVRKFNHSKPQQKNYHFYNVTMVIFGTFLICYLPNLIMRGLMSYTPDHPYLRQIVKILVYSHAMVNPVIYLATDRKNRINENLLSML